MVLDDVQFIFGEFIYARKLAEPLKTSHLWRFVKEIWDGSIHRETFYL